MIKLKISLVAIIALGALSNVSAMKFQTIGYQSISMGGAGVANSSGSVSAYNNPALLGKAKYDVEISLGGGLAYSDHGAGAAMQSLEDTNFVDTLDKDYISLTDADKSNLLSGKTAILNMDGKSVQIAPQAYIAAQIQGFGIGVFGTSDIVATANVDQAYDRLILETTAGSGFYSELKADGTTASATIADYTSSSMEYAVNNGLTNANVTGIAIAEVPVAYGSKIETNAGDVYIGGSLKYMTAVSYTETLRIDNEGSATNNVETKSDSFGVDLGLAYEPSFSKDLTLALVGKNLNRPKFKIQGLSDYELEPMLRAGLAYNIFESLEVAMDADLTKNKTLIANLDNQMVGGGLNYHPASWFSIRAGLMQNMATGDESGLVYTAGLGFGLKWFQLDVSAQMASKSSTVNDTTYPQEGKVAVALVSRW